MFNEAMFRETLLPSLGNVNDFDANPKALDTEVLLNEFGKVITTAKW